MKFEIVFEGDVADDTWFIDNCGGELVPTGATKYPPFEKIMVEVKDFNELKDLLDRVDKRFRCFSSATVSFDPACIFINL